ncbi:hypothetical protein [Streptomyces sp. W4I9-2]|uniref:hypothetical protein n=1 Tax=Streptomyces sp. W4I9-2 TaxID=3042297 RepID=UPI002788C25B|nr:hypothetical protein [Streptomyces sp. W4I9-2]MDQ0694209.1 hypothetical protein [Streptomyces sp. W4I9-2]
MAAAPSYRELAGLTLGQAAEHLNAVPSGNVASAEVTARSAHAQAIATVATAQALLEIGDILRELLSQGARQ